MLILVLLSSLFFGGAGDDGERTTDGRAHSSSAETRLTAGELLSFTSAGGIQRETAAGAAVWKRRRRRGGEGRRGGEEAAASVDIVHGSSDDGCGVARGPVLVTQVHHTSVLWKTTFNCSGKWAILPNGPNAYLYLEPILTRKATQNELSKQQLEIKTWCLACQHQSIHCQICTL